MATFLQRILGSGSEPILEQVLRFTAARHRLIAENIANVDTPGYVQKDLSEKKFQQALADRLRERGRRIDGASLQEDLPLELESSRHGILFPDGNNRSMEQLASDLAKNALLHNVAAELLRKQFLQLDMALKERVV
jgi:flagellar basal-body rod protein FlgB